MTGQIEWRGHTLADTETDGEHCYCYLCQKSGLKVELYAYAPSITNGWTAEVYVEEESVGYATRDTPQEALDVAIAAARCYFLARSVAVNYILESQ